MLQRFILTQPFFPLRNVEDTKPSSSSASAPAPVKPGLTLNPLTGLPYTQKYTLTKQHILTLITI